jgi:glycosyltransferase involved in cell wall biosynthesis
MKLLYITNGINGAGGLERVLAVKASYLSDQLGYEVHILSLNEPQPKPFYAFSPKLQFHSCEVKGNPIQYIFSYIKGIKSTVSKIKPDIISVCDDGLKGFFLPLLLGKNHPLIYERHVSKSIEMHEHFSFIKKESIFLKWKLMSFLANKFDAFVLLTNGNIQEWKNLKNLHVIPNPLSFYPVESSTLQNKKVIAVGKQGYQKGYDLLLQAWQKATIGIEDWKLEIYGKIEPQKKLNELANKLGISDKVVFFPPTQKIEEKYLDTSLFVLSSRFEGFGMVLIEAMACGLPCVSFDCPYGPADIITHGEDGLLVPNGDVEQLAEAIIDIMKHEHRRQAMGIAAKENVKRYLPEHIVPIWEELFKQLLANK